MVTGLGLLAVSAVLLIAGAELFTENVAGAARRLGISVFGAAFLLAGAEPEEMITAVVASGRHRPGLAAGDAIGANLTMLTLVLGLAALARPLPFGGRVRTYAAWSALAGGLAALAVASGRIERWQGALLLAAYLAGVALLWWRERQPPAIGELAEESEDGRSRPPVLALGLSSGGIALMIAGGWLAVGGAERVVAALRLSDSAVGLTLLALATTAELFALAWAALRRGVAEVAVAGVVGSVAYNATATLGAAALIRPLATGEKMTMTARLLLHLLALEAATQAGFCWIDEPLGHLDPDTRRQVASLLAVTPSASGVGQILVTTYEEPLVRRITRRMPGQARLVHVRAGSDGG